MKKINLKIKNEDIENLSIAEEVLLSGYIYTARDAAHKRLCEMIDKGYELPIPLYGESIYYMGPTPTKVGQVIGSAGPTTSGRMDVWTPKLISLGLKCMIGKGERSEEVKAAIKKYGAIYFETYGGCGALLANCIKESKVIAFDDLGTESIKRLYIEDFPAVVSIK